MAKKKKRRIIGPAEETVGSISATSPVLDPAKDEAPSSPAPKNDVPPPRIPWALQLLLLILCTALVAGIFYGIYLPRMRRDAEASMAKGDAYFLHAQHIAGDTESAYAVHDELAKTLWTFTSSRHEFQNDFFRLGMTYDQQLAKAARGFELIAEWEGHYAPAYAQVASAMEEHGLMEVFSHLFEELKIQGEQAEAALAEGLAAAAAADKTIFELVPHPEAPHLMIIKQQHRGELSRLFSMLENAKNQTEEFTMALIETMALFDEERSLDLAVKSYWEAVWADPLWPEPRLRLAECYAFRGWQEAAGETYLKVLRLDPKGPLGRTAMERLSEYSNRNSDMAYFTGIGFLCQSKYPEAADQFRSLVESDEAMNGYYTAQSWRLWALSLEGDPHKIENFLREQIWIEGTIPPTGVSRAALP